MSRNDREKRYHVYASDESEDNDRYDSDDETSMAIEVSTTAVQIPEGGQAALNVRLTQRPEARTVTVNVSRVSGDADINISSGQSLTFRRNRFNQWKTVTLAAAEDGDPINGQAVFRLSGSGLTDAQVTAVEGDNDANLPPFDILVDPAVVSIMEGGSAVFNIKLSADPGRAVEITVGHQSGDTDISVSAGATQYFDSATWQSDHPVTLAAVEDNADSVNGEATFAVSTPDAPAVYVTAKEVDNDGATSPKRLVIDPISRIEGHLRIEVEVNDGAVTKAWSSATLFRGIETILIDRDPLDAPLITQRLCGVCTYVHNLCSVRAIEDALGVTITDNARDVRNLVLGAQFLHDHLVHFYHLHGLDWADITSALSADPAATQALADEISPNAEPIDFSSVKSRLQSLVDTGNLGPFANAYWGHPAYHLSPEENLLVSAHYLVSLKKQVSAAKMMAILGGKNPHPQSTVVGGVTCAGELSTQRLTQFRAFLEEIREVIQTIYMPDLKLVASRYSQWAGMGGFKNFMAYGEFPLGPNIPNDLFMPRGMIINGDLFNVQALNEGLITEHVARSWYDGAADRHPSSGETNPNYTGLDTDARYSWLKAPRYDSEAVEVGPLARVLVGYGLGRADYVNAVQSFLTETGLGEADLLSTLGRTAARAIETQIIADGMVTWLDALENRLINGDKGIYSDYTMVTSSGIGFLEAPRGALGHWINIQGNTIDNYQMVVPTTWNLGPRCADNIPGPLEQTLVGLPVVDTANPLEVLRVVHAFDPCIACGVHVIDKNSGQTHEFTVV
jgi:[NiFe] hydrogenase large subunit